jgi:hypothetical protein
MLVLGEQLDCDYHWSVMYFWALGLALFFLGFGRSKQYFGNSNLDTTWLS